MIMNYAIISGSHRGEDVAQSFKVSNWLAGALQKKEANNNSDIISLSGNPYPLWDEGAWNAKSDLYQKMAQPLGVIGKADALIIVAAEYGGMVPAGLKNFLLYITSEHVAHKPCLLVGVSASRGGTYPIAELRMSGYKNNRMVYIPDHLIVQSVGDVMNDHHLNNGEQPDLYIKKRAHYSLDVLAAYASALKDMRSAGDLLDEAYPFGM